MKRIVFLILVLLSPNLFAQQSQSVFESAFSNIQRINFDALPVFEDGFENDVFTGEYLWWNDSKSLSGFGFVDIGYKRPWFTNHSLNFSPFKRLSFLSLSAEGGGSQKGMFNQIGPKVNVNKTPVVGMISKLVAKNLFVAHYRQTFGYRNPYETLFVWETKHIPVFGLELYSAGFLRTRGGGRTDYAQPQIWLRHNQFPIAIGVELEVIGKDVYPLCGMKIFAFKR